MSNYVILSYLAYSSGIDTELVTDILRYSGTINSIGHRWYIIIREDYAGLLILKYPELEPLQLPKRLEDFREITVKIA